MAAWLIVASGAKPGGNASALPPGRQYRLTIEGNNTVTFVPEVGLDPKTVDYKAQVEYIVNTRTAAEEAARAEAAGTAKKKPVRKPSAAAKARRKEKEAENADAGAAANPTPQVTAAVDLAVHASETRFRQGGQIILESRMSRSRFQGRLQPDAPVTTISASEAPPRLQEMLKRFDVTVASMLLDADSKVVGRKIRPDAPMPGVIETILSIHTPIPRDVAFWEAPTQLAMGQGQTAKGMLRFEKNKESVSRTGGLVNVKISGVLKAEGVVVGNFIKDGTYTVNGEQSYDPSTREWTSSSWSVAVNNELANQAGQTVAHARGTMKVQSKRLGEASSSSTSAATSEAPIARP